MKGNAAQAAPRELLGVYAKHCPFGHVIAAEAMHCGICVMQWELEDRRAKDLEAGRTGNEPDREDDDAEG